MAHTKSGGSTKLGRDSRSKRLGVKLNHGQQAKAGEIIIRQRGIAVLPGKNVRRAGDDTLYAAVTGMVQFKDAKKKKFDGSYRYAKKVSVVSE
ncbi:MAG: 50S ribosomal protein L27 [Candidatus Harrisonbacteria bacterium CG10_big_fil_rev_8_21_14_0_10_49_15]|uniref:Large ribosomal subunit protein bL27 n=1 Tax=Candidatus Harrisonbacteria bacterium CG10_big_fil_rev_8_21_14_0_10_49_15 TaxID=1974587 RepID=A0A2H0UM79_9BACT|nr:MAG: 50S ribosomal protein L27 [Candidatus Harrisonbacteria bacterium CG10_big_fil_rev_8_21_14_0_10_49_15]